MTNTTSQLSVPRRTTTSDMGQISPPFVVGIDLGTTNSLLAVAGLPDELRFLPPPPAAQGAQTSLGRAVPVQLLKLPQLNLDGTVAEHVLFPSVVFQAAGDGQRLVGMGAKEAKFHYTKDRSVFYSVKRDLGTDRDPYYVRAVSPDLNTPVKVTAVILRAMKEAAEAKLGRSLSDVPTIVTIPASFQSAQRRDTLRAARMAGLRVDDQGLFDEPNAALLAYMNRQRVQLRWHHEETVLVFDFGGGTCDISLINVSYAPSSFKIQLRRPAISPYEQRGGDEIEQHIVHTALAEQI
ncbi:MAG: Hsp70 family protein [Chloroflexi bacterium]|nr:Hsp70 family protein [Chloroflexota bacterium]